MTTKFYDALQMDPAVLKRKIAACDTRQEKNYYWIAMAVRSVLIVAFAIVFISLLSGVVWLGQHASGCGLILHDAGIRFVNFEYCIGDSLVTLAVVLAILVLVPSAAWCFRRFPDPAALYSLFCHALHDYPTARNGKRRLI